MNCECCNCAVYRVHTETERHQDRGMNNRVQPVKGIKVKGGGTGDRGYSMCPQAAIFWHRLLCFSVEGRWRRPHQTRLSTCSGLRFPSLRLQQTKRTIANAEGFANSITVRVTVPGAPSNLFPVAEPPDIDASTFFFTEGRQLLRGAQWSLYRVRGVVCAHARVVAGGGSTSLT